MSNTEQQKEKIDLENTIAEENTELDETEDSIEIEEIEEVSEAEELEKDVEEETEEDSEIEEFEEETEPKESNEGSELLEFEYEIDTEELEEDVEEEETEEATEIEELAEEAKVEETEESTELEEAEETTEIEKLEETSVAEETEVQELKEETNVVEIAEVQEAKVEEVKVEENKAKKNKSKAPKQVELKITDLINYFGDRELKPFNNSSILRHRFNLQLEKCAYPVCREVVQKDTGKVLGLTTSVRLDHVWEIANSQDAKKVCGGKSFNLTEEEWNTEKEKLEKYILSKKSTKEVLTEADTICLLEDVWNLTELEFEGLGFERPNQVANFIKTAIYGLMEENARLEKKWHKIKKYSHLVPLSRKKGGLFNKRDAEKLRSIGIKYLNDIVEHSVFALKRLLLEKSMNNIINDINKAFKEDWERRKDFRYKFFPFFTAFTNFIVICALLSTYQYTLIKNLPATNVLMGFLTLVTIDFLAILRGAHRRKRRVKVVPNYVYFTRVVAFSFFAFIVAGLLSVGYTFNYYQRYDGYDDTVYYRDLEEGKIAVAGLRDQEIENLIIPGTIDGKTVVEIDRKAFKDASISSVVIPDTVEYIDKKAFYECVSLSKVTLPTSLKEISSEAFANCTYLKWAPLTNSLVTIGEKAFYNTILETVDIPQTVTSIGNEAFYLCPFRDFSLYCNGNITQINGFLETDKYYGYFGGNSTITFKGTGIVPANILKDNKRFKSAYIEDGVTGFGVDAFYNSEISSVRLPNDITSLQNKTFYGCAQLAYIYDGENIQSIGESCFELCVSLSSFDAPKTLTTISANAFKDSGVKSITLPEGLTGIGVSAFEGCSRLRSVDIPSTVTNIGSKAFSSCGELTSFSIYCDKNYVNSLIDIFPVQMVGMSVTIKGSGVVPSKILEGFSSVTEITLDKDVKELSESAFEGLENLSTITLSSNITSLPKRAFYGCKFLSTVNGLDDLYSIGESCFEDCSRLKRLSYNNRLLSVESKAFKNTKLTSFNFTSDITEIGEEAFLGAKLTSIDLTHVKSIGSGAFKNNTSLAEVSLGNGIDSIESEAFQNTAIGEISLPYSVKTIGESAFMNCAKLRVVSMPGVEVIKEKAFKNTWLDTFDSNTVTTIGDEAFAGTDIYYIYLPKSLVQISSSAFNECERITTVIIPFIGETRDKSNSCVVDDLFESASNNSISLTIFDMDTIYSKNFNGSQKIYSLVVEGSLNTIQAEAFKDSSVKVVQLPSSLESIGKGAFESSTLEQISGIDNLTNIAEATFKNCDGLYSVSSIANVKTIGNEAFKGCFNYEFNGALSNITDLGEYAFAESGVKSVDFGTGLIVISKGAFSNCSNLTQVNFDTMKVTKICEDAFCNTGLANESKVIKFNSNLKTIDPNAFKGVTFTDVYFSKTMENVDVKAFGNSPSFKLHVPKSLKEKYELLFKDSNVTIIENN